MKINLSRFIGKQASEVVKALNPNVLMIIQKSGDNHTIEVIRDETFRIVKSYYKIDSSKLPPASFSLFRFIIVSAIDAGILRENDYVFCTADRSVGIEFDGMFMFFKIDESFLNFSKKKLREEINNAVFNTVLEIAKEIGREGREGKKVGTSFIIGDSERVLEKSSQLILNPFSGYPASSRNILDPNIRETIKNFALLDGAFVIGDNGVIHAAGRYLAPSNMNAINLPGLGARHQSACAMTAETNAVAIVVSESGGLVRIFRKGKQVDEIDPNERKE